MTATSNALDRVLVLEMVRVTEAAAIAASKLIGRGDNEAADAAAVEAMRAASAAAGSSCWRDPTPASDACGRPARTVASRSRMTRSISAARRAYPAAR